ncbi:DUF1365 domain-containing protein [Pseudoruegeria sp. SK021]|uniref:DUF1365 domain-containing protein n=1 Tax=Pseudoruegeria sp. SK021 TaxID=1933035 RepID=UPI000A23D995|nr:DUF1365 domain-containing protein [Pseudoruegeria sp. SK021]OSP55024.1 cyclopropane-fatty-acyl-phospholipid synthase [Pseudoruegeria sp. SK021]
MSAGIDLIAGETFHSREGAIRNAFRYSVDFCLLDPDQPGGPSLFSRNRRNLTSLYDSDHGGAPGKGRGTAWVREVLAAYGLDRADGPILLLAQPRVLGHVFNPVSFWLCYGGSGTLQAVIAEVSNTFGDRHSYLCALPDQRPITRSDEIRAQKIFHVSPFQPIAGDYRFRFDIRDDRIGLWIVFQTEQGRLFTNLIGPRRAMTNRAILAAALRRPFGSRRVLGLIHWQAVKLWWKGAQWHHRPEAPAKDVSR